MIDENTKKRAIAYFIDSFIIGVILDFIQFLFNGWYNLENFDFLIIVIFLSSRDLIFRNASIGKKILGIAVYDNDWQLPRFHILLKRSFLTATVGCILWWKLKFIDGDIITLFDIERDKLGTRVIDRKIYKELESTAKKQEGRFCPKYERVIQRIFERFISLNLTSAVGMTVDILMNRAAQKKNVSSINALSYNF